MAQRRAESFLALSSLSLRAARIGWRGSLAWETTLLLSSDVDALVVAPFRREVWAWLTVSPSSCCWPWWIESDRGRGLNSVTKSQSSSSKERGCFCFPRWEFPFADEVFLSFEDVSCPEPQPRKDKRDRVILRLSVRCDGLYEMYEHSLFLMGNWNGKGKITSGASVPSFVVAWLPVSFRRVRITNHVDWNSRSILFRTQTIWLYRTCQIVSNRPS